MSAEEDPRYWPCVMCGAPAGVRCRGARGETLALHVTRRLAVEQWRRAEAMPEEARIHVAGLPQLRLAGSPPAT
jgi:hypothetical protein